MNIKPLADRVVLKQLKAEEKTAGGIYLPETAQKKPEYAEVVAVGPGKKDGDKVTAMEVKVGDKVIYQKYAGTTVKVGTDELLIVNESDIMAVMK